jgi:hypothetical protein
MTELRSFLLRYVGARFEGHRLPLDVLPDLSAFRDLLVSYVKAEWRAAHTERDRLPKGFEKSIAFDLVEIRDWERRTATRLGPGHRPVVVARLQGRVGTTGRGGLRQGPQLDR